MFGMTVLGYFIAYILLSLIFWGFAGYAYRVNEQLPEDDPRKRDFHPSAVNLAPITWPFSLVFAIIFYSLIALAYVILFVIKALLYGLFIVLFTLALVFIRKPFILKWVEKVAGFVGRRLLEANTALIKLFQIKWISYPQQI